MRRGICKRVLRIEELEMVKNVKKRKKRGKHGFRCFRPRKEKGWKLPKKSKFSRLQLQMVTSFELHIQNCSKSVK